tara:strand:- start:1686 stop:1973 length:288 start_codon:yes stop_codon:yes gene_type:complete
MNYVIEFDEYSLELTAKALETINPGRSSVAHIRDMVNANMYTGSTSMGTAGWEATGFFPKGRDNVMVVRFAVQAYSVNKYLETLSPDKSPHQGES